jgi:hypothetical protein
LEEVKKRKELEEALLRASEEIAQLKQERDLPKNDQNTTMEEQKEVISDNLILEASGQIIKPLQEYLDHDENCVREPETLLIQRKLAASFSPSSVMQSPFDEDCCIPSYFICPILQVFNEKFCT